MKPLVCKKCEIKVGYTQNGLCWECLTRDDKQMNLSKKEYELTYKEHCEKSSDSKLTKKQQYDISSVINSLGALMFFEETTIEVAAQLGRNIVVLEKLMDEEEE